MRSLAADEIRGTWGTLLLPINSDESIDFSRLSDQLERCVAWRKSLADVNRDFRGGCAPLADSKPSGGSSAAFRQPRHEKNGQNHHALDTLVAQQLHWGKIAPGAVPG